VHALVVEAGETLPQRTEETMIEVVKPDQLSDELLDAEIPCGGIDCRPIRRSCTHPAVLRSMGHGCQPMNPTLFKCVMCWKIWHDYTMNAILRGGIQCTHCHGVFTTVESFSDYRLL
jgi:DNA-directed RNA polymerase subunit RPC12/RpoP